MESLFNHLLAETRAVHDATPPLREFADWPEDLVFEQPVPQGIPALPTIEAMAGKGALYAALAAVCPHASWVQTYSEAEVGRHFLDHYGHIELFGPAGIFRTQACRAFIGYWGPGLFYPMHDHEAEEIYPCPDRALPVRGGRRCPCRSRARRRQIPPLGPVPCHDHGG
ncbi:MAG: hypothetical protein CM15mP115_22960 [Alphaproteobacteria bacterium]|nr:MAG: hypothetical protein CM15mP115_22960 [Alphaproteobacteria bacterium]